jgi:membrane associated rhomboid family serine protease
MPHYPHPQNSNSKHLNSKHSKSNYSADLKHLAGHRPGRRPQEAWSFIPPHVLKPLPPHHQNDEYDTVYLSQLATGPLPTLQEWALVLASQKIPYSITQSPEGPWVLEVEKYASRIAAEQLRLYREENPERAHHAPLPILRVSLQPLWVLLIPVICTLLQFLGLPWMENAGIADSAKIVAGEWWRIFTAQTLHAGAYHLASNLVSGFLVLSLLAARLPLTRIVPWLVLAAGAANLETAFLVGAEYRSLGFSTFVFAALGALGTIETRMHRVHGHGMGGLMRRFTPWFAVLTIAVFTGIGDETSHTDIFGHFFGLAMGILAGFAPTRRLLRWGTVPQNLDVVLAAGTYAFFAGVWVLAYLGR